VDQGRQYFAGLDCLNMYRGQPSSSGATGFISTFSTRDFLLQMGAAAKLAAYDNGPRREDHPVEGETAMSTRSWGAALTVAGALFALSACDTPSRSDFDSLRSQVANLESRVTAAESSAAESAAAADQCTQVCDRAERSFQQSTRK
jgi:hypothetical protein